MRKFTLILVMCFALFSSAYAQKTITGKVIDESGLGMPGVAVVQKGTTIGSITDVDGKFSVSVPEGAILQFSFMGMKTQEVTVGSEGTININMEPDAIGLEEVVAIGYGTQKKVNLTGAVSTIKGDEIVKRPVANVETMLQGRMPGVQIVQNSGEPGNESVSIRIRGTGTFSSAGSNPLILVDGVQGSLSDLNPNNIESISVLKDAASASIYGARAANGVILVTTKTGEVGKITMNYSGNFAIHTPTKLFDIITNSAEYMELFNEARVNSGLTDGLYSDEVISKYRNGADQNQYPNTDWLDLMFNPAPTQTHNLSFSGGNKNTTFNVSLGYVNQDGVMRGFDYEKYNVRVNVSSSVNEHIRFGGNFLLKKGMKSAACLGSTDHFIAIMSQAPTYAPQLPDGSGRYTYKAYDFEKNNKNPVALIENNVMRNTTDYAIVAQGWLDVQLLKGLKWYTKAAVNLDFSKYDDFKPILPLYNYHTYEFMSFLDVGGAEGLEVRDDQSEYKNLFTYLNFDHDFGSFHNFRAQLGYSVEDNVSTYLRGYRKDYPKEDLTELDAGGLSVQQAGGTTTEWALMSFFGRLGYSYKSRYLLEANLRYDGTSRLAPGNRWGVFPSYSAGWRLSEESFFKGLNANWINNLKFRGSYGELGNQNIGLYPYQSILNLTGSYSFDDATLSTGVAQNRLSNTNIKWETTRILDIGFDLTVFDALVATFDWYKKTTTDILRASQATDVVGLAPPIVNNGTMENVGVEFDLRYSKRIGSGLFYGGAYTIGFNIDSYKNKLVDFGEREISGYSLREEGREWDAFYMLEWVGIFQSDEEIANSPKQFNDATMPGDLKFKDQNNDGIINNDDRTVLSGRYPKFNYSFNFAFDWKGFDFSTQFQGVSGVKYYVNDWGTIPFVQGAPPTSNWRNRWTETNHSTTMPRMYWGWSAPERIKRNSSWYLQNGSYLRLKNLTVGYTLPNTLFDQIGIERLRLYFSGDNLITITDYPGLDPERGGSGRFVNYPQNKIYSVGVNVNF
ncbi:MAG: SusC/RagA family TonB-linked outer membrane protein [Bacteroidales bacterium]